MKQTSIETSRHIRGLISINIDESKEEVRVYIREAVDCRIESEGEILLSTVGFNTLVMPIIEAQGFEIVIPDEVV